MKIHGDPAGWAEREPPYVEAINAVLDCVGEGLKKIPPARQGTFPVEAALSILATDAEASGVDKLHLISAAFLSAFTSDLAEDHTPEDMQNVINSVLQRIAIMGASVAPGVLGDNAATAKQATKLLRDAIDGIAQNPLTVAANTGVN
jgi:hypothetical protein